MLSNRNKKVIARIKSDREAARRTKKKPKWKDIEYLLALLEEQEHFPDNNFILEFLDKETPLDGWAELDDGDLDYIKRRFVIERERDETNGESKRYNYRFVRVVTERREIYKPEDLTD